MYGKKLKELRIEKGLSQKELAEYLHTTQKSISKYELEFLDLNTNLIIKICDFFDISADELLGIREYAENKPIKHNTTINESPNFNVSTHTNNGILNIQYKSNK